MPITEDRIAKLRDFGLSEYAARTYLALLDLGVTEARAVSRLTKVPTSKIYHVLDQLHEKGLVEILPEFPKKYAPIPFAEYLEKLQREHEDAARSIERDRDDLTRLFRFHGDVEVGDRGNFTVVRGRRNVLAKVAELVDGASEDLLVLGTRGMAAHLGHMREALEAAKARGAALRVKAPLTGDSIARWEPLSALAEIRARVLDTTGSADNVSIVIADNDRALLINFVPDDHNQYSGQDVAIFTDQEALIGALKAMVEPRWASARRFESVRAEVLEGRAPEFTRLYASEAEATAAVRDAVARGISSVLVASREPDLSACPMAAVVVEAAARAGASVRAILDVPSAETASALPEDWDVRHLRADAVTGLWVLDRREAFVLLAGTRAGEHGEELVVHTNHPGTIASVVEQFESAWSRGQPLAERLRELDVFPSVRPRDLGLGQLFDSMQDAVVVADDEGKIVLWNAAAERTFGWTSAEAVGRSVEILVPDESRAGHRAGMQRFRAGGAGALLGRGTAAEFEAVRKDGTRVSVELTLGRIRESPKPHVLAIARDVTERKRAQERLAESERRLAEAQRVARVGSWTWDVRADRLEWSDDLRAAYGIPAGAEVGTMESYFSRVHPEDREAVRARVRRAVESGGVYESEHRVLHGDGTVGWRYARAEPVRDESGEVLRYVGISQDVTERRRMQEDLQRAEAQLKDLVDSVQAVVWRADARTFRFTFVSREAETILGYPLERWYEPGFWASRIHPEDRDWAVDLCKRETAACRSHEFEYRMLAADGGTVWLRDIVRVVSRDGEPVELLGIMVDIRARKAAEHAMHEAKELADAVIRSSADGIIAFDADGRYTIWNPGMERLTGLAAAEVLGKRGEDIFPFLREGPASERLKRVLEGERFALEKIRFRIPQTGLEGDVEATYAPLRDLDGRVVGGVGIVRDVQPRLEAEKRLKASEERYRILAENASDIISVSGADGAIRYVSPAIRAILGVAPEGLVGKVAAPLIHPDDRDYVATMRERVFAGEPVRATFRAQRADGAWLWVEAHAVPVRGPEGQVVEMVTVTRDMTAQKAAEEELVRQRDLHEAALRALDEMGDAFIVYDAERILDASESYCRLLGYTREELRQLPSFDALVPPEDREAMRERLRRRVGGNGAPDHFETTLLARDGGRRHVRCSVRRVPNTDPPMFVCVLRPLDTAIAADEVRLRPRGRDAPEKRTRS